jgi:hypothetical protein
MRVLARLVTGGGSGSRTTALLKRVLLSMLVVGLLGTVTAKRVYAVFVTESANTNSQTATGVFTLDVAMGAIGGGNDCNSYLGTFTTGTPSSANANSCTGATGSLFASTPRYPGDATTSAVQVRNTGSIASQDLKLTITGCTAQGLGGGGALLGTQSSPCTAAVAGGLEFYIQETTAGGVALTNGCLYPDGNPDPPGVGTQYPVCNGVYWEPGSFAGFPTSPTSASCWDLGRIPAQTTRYFTIGLQFPQDSANSYQGTSALFSLRWHADSVDGTISTANCVND